MCDYVVACEGFRSKFGKVKVIEDNESRPRNPVSFEVRCQQEPQDGDGFESSQAFAWSQRGESVVYENSTRGEKQMMADEGSEVWTHACG